MNRKSLGFLACAMLITGAVCAGESVSEKPRGFRFFNNHLTVKPYVSLSYTFDSNIDTGKHGTDDSIIMVNPGTEFEWRGERWSLVGSLWYRYNYYCEYDDVMGENSYGEQLQYTWATSAENERGWSLALTESYAYISQSDNINSGEGRGVWRDREHVDAAGVLEHRFTDRWHSSLKGQYNWIDYKNDTGKYVPLYGYQEFSAGIEAGYAATPWTDFLVAGGYSGYRQKKGESALDSYSNESQVWTVMGGIGTRATEKIQYRLLMGASWLEYGGHSGADSGWTYQLSGNWRLTRQLQWSAVGASYYQPSERTLGSAVKVYSISTGLSYLTLGDRLSLRSDVAFRYEENAYSDRYLAANNDYDETILSVRLGATYTLNRWVGLFADLTWEEEWADDHDDYDYDRFRGTVGVRFTY